MPDAKILVIDDEKLVRWSLEQNLIKEGYTVLTAEKGLAGLEIYKEESRISRSWTSTCRTYPASPCLRA